MARTDWSRTVTNGARTRPLEAPDPAAFGRPEGAGQGLEHLVYDAALDNSLWPQLLLELINQMTGLQPGSPDRSGEVEDIRDLVIHFRRALTISERLVALQERAALSETMLDALSIGIALLDRDGGVIFANAALRSGRAAACLAGPRAIGLARQEDGEPRPLRAWLAPDPGGRPPIRHLDVVGPDGRTVESVLVLPRAEAMRLGFPPTAAAVLLAGGAWEREAVQAFAAECGLTPREAALVGALARHGDLRRAAASSGLSYESGRTYLRRVFEKSGTGRQAELLVRLARSPLTAIRSDPGGADRGSGVRRMTVLPDGRHLEAFVLGPEDGRPVLLSEALTGVTIDVLGYPDLCRAWLERFGLRLVIPCRPGNYQSDFHPMDSLRDIVPDLVHLLDRLGIRTFGLLSVSFGTGTALAIAHELGERVERLVMASSMYPAYRPANWRELDQFYQLSLVLARRWPSLFRQILPFFLRSVLHNPETYFDRYCRNARSADDREILRNPTLRRRIPMVLQERTAHGIDGMIDENILIARDWDFDPARIACPIEMYHGSLDHVSPVEAARALANVLPTATLIERAGFGHYQYLRDWPWMLARAAGRDVGPGTVRYEFPEA